MRKTFKRKSTAKKARKRGQGVYKVKAGWRLSKKTSRKKSTRRRRRSCR